VNILLLGPDGVNAVGELLRLCEVRQFRLHPDHIAVWCVSHRAVNGALTAALVPVVTLACPRGFPVEVHIYAGQALGDGAGFGVTLALALLRELVDEFLLIYVYTGIDCVGYCLVVELHVCFLRPGVLDSLEFGAVLAGLLGSVHEVAKRLEGGVCAAHDVVVIARVDGRGDERGGFGVSASNRKKVGA
jgi:hypothetical protein